MCLCIRIIKMKYLKFFLFITFLFLSEIAFSQCAMCRAVLESNADNSVAEGINNGIIFLMVLPYLLMGGLGYFIYRYFKTKHSKSV